MKFQITYRTGPANFIEWEIDGETAIVHGNGTLVISSSFVGIPTVAAFADGFWSTCVPVDET